MVIQDLYAAMGRDFAMGLLPISGCSGDISVEGFVTKPLNGHGTRGRQLFFVNGRFIKSQLLTAALEEAYRNQLLKGKFPGCVLRLTMPADRLDVNVHPAKTVVKFVNDKEAFNAVYYTVLDALNTPTPQPKKPQQESFYQAMTVQQYRERVPQPEEKKPLGSYTVRPAAPASQPLEVHDVAPRKGEAFTVTSSGVSYRITPPAVQEEPSAPAAPMPERAVPVPAEPVQETIVSSPAEEEAVPQSAAQQTVEPVCQKKGYGRRLIRFICQKYKNQFHTLQAGTGDSPLTVPFYEHCGFIRGSVIPHFFMDHYDHPIYEGGKQLDDMIYFQLKL